MKIYDINMFRFLLLLLMVPIQIIKFKYREVLNKYVFTNFQRSISSLEANKPPFLMIASIGNPEPQYQGTRHNVGHWALEELVNNYWTSFDSFQKHKNLSGGVISTSTSEELSNVLLFKSIDTFMNLQGSPISKAWNKIRSYQMAKYSPALVVLHDELQVPLGKFQIRKQLTSARGHNGLRSIDSLMGSGYTKISIGIGKPKSGDASKHVLSPFNAKEHEELTYEVMPQIASVLQEMACGKYVFEKNDPASNAQKKR